MIITRILGKLIGSFLGHVSWARYAKTCRGLRTAENAMINELWDSRIISEMILCNSDGEAKVKHDRGRAEAIAEVRYLPPEEAKGFRDCSIRMPLPQCVKSRRQSEKNSAL